MRTFKLVVLVILNSLFLTVIMAASLPRFCVFCCNLIIIQETLSEQLVSIVLMHKYMQLILSSLDIWAVSYY